METKQTTVKEAIAIAIRQLLNISVPRALNAQIGVPIDNTIELLHASLDAIEKAEQEKAKEEAQEEQEEENGDTDAE